MAGLLAAVLGTGQTKYVAKRHDVSMNGLVREAIDKALADSGCTFDDIDAVVVGKAPDFFEGVMMPELFMADAVGATGKPLIRVHTAGSVGGSTAVVAASLVQSGKYRRVLAMAWEKQSESNAMWALSIPVPFTKPVGAGAGGYFAPHVRAYIRRSGAPTHIGAMVAVKDRLNGAKNPLAHLHQPDITLEKVLSSQMLWDPIRFDETCPSSDGACALVIGDEAAADARLADGHPVAWIHATPPRRCGKRRASPVRSTRSTSPRFTCRSRGLSRCGWRTSVLRQRATVGSSPKRVRRQSAAVSHSTRPVVCCRRIPSARPA
jgi:acetyl-CoA C-acetyltransferase